jgi:gluconolactonase
MTTPRRALLGAGLSLLASPAVAQWRMSERYPDPAVRILDPAFARYRVPLAAIMRLAEGWRWGEGPAWFGDHRYLVWSDPHDSRLYRWDEVTGQTAIFRHDANNPNGNTRDREGRLITCEHLTAAWSARSVTAASRCWPTATRASASTRRTRWW